MCNSSKLSRTKDILNYEKVQEILWGVKWINIEVHLEILWFAEKWNQVIVNENHILHWDFWYYRKGNGELSSASLSKHL